MHTRGLRVLVTFFATLVAGIVLATPAVGFGGEAPPVGDDGSDLRGSIAEQIDVLNNGSSGGGEPPTCEYEHDGETLEGHLRWRLTANEQEVWQDINDSDEGTWYRYECWSDEDECEDPSWEGDDGCYGDLTSSSYCGSPICMFPDINPSKLAWYAVDEMVQELPAPSPQFNPPGGTTYVNFETWMWVENIPDGGAISADTMSVPGFTVNTTAEIDSVHWTMGDGGELECPLTVTEESAAQSECTYRYARSSANQPNNTYTGQASTLWEATWIVPEFGISGTVDAPRDTDFELQVAEVQTINR